jgi:hypothetical protein
MIMCADCPLGARDGDAGDGRGRAVTAPQPDPEDDDIPPVMMMMVVVVVVMLMMMVTDHPTSSHGAQTAPSVPETDTPGTAGDGPLRPPSLTLDADGNPTGPPVTSPKPEHSKTPR